MVIVSYFLEIVNTNLEFFFFLFLFVILHNFCSAFLNNMTILKASPAERETRREESFIVI